MKTIVKSGKSRHLEASFEVTWAVPSHGQHRATIKLATGCKRRKRRELVLHSSAELELCSLSIFECLVGLVFGLQTLTSTQHVVILHPHTTYHLPIFAHICPYLPKVHQHDIAHRPRKSRWAPHKSVSRVSRSNEMTIQSLRLEQDLGRDLATCTVPK